MNYSSVFGKVSPPSAKAADITVSPKIVCAATPATDNHSQLLNPVSRRQPGLSMTNVRLAIMNKKF
jgi:hypothetical protein